MKNRTLFPRLAALVLSLVFIVSVFPAASAAAPEALERVGYYGDVSICIMDGDMASGYAKALSDIPSKNRNNLRLALLDLSGDGLPVLVAATLDSKGTPATFGFWSWDGAKVTADPVDITSDFVLGTREGKPVLRIGGGDQAPLGQPRKLSYYETRGGKLVLSRQEVIHTAQIEANGLYALTDYFAGMRVAVEDLKSMGWVLFDEGQGLMTAALNGSLVPLADEAAIDRWLADNNAAFTPYDKQLVTGGTLADAWTTANTMLSALQSYARAVSAPGGAFLDIPSKHFSAQPVAWAVEKGIANGTGKHTFSPNQTCTTAQILTFLYRAAGEPAPTIGNPFKDLSDEAYYYNAAVWAFENGLVSGNSFPANSPCSRADTVTYLWKLAGSPAADDVSFSDVPNSAPYAQAVAWAVEQNITQGTGDDTFSPDQTCTRAQIVTFLYRAYA